MFKIPCHLIWRVISSKLKGALLLIFLLICVSCENNIEIVKKITNRKELPTLSAKNVEILYSDSGKIIFKMVAKEYEKYTNVDKPYMKFPKGLTFYIYDTVLNTTTIIKANYAIYHENEKMLEAHNDVEAKNLVKNEQLNTEELFWDRNRGIIFSNKFTRIINKHGVFTSDAGFEGTETLSKYRLKGGIKGKANIATPESDEKNP